MKKIFEGEIYEILPLSNGIVFSYKKDVVDDDLLIFYKMLSFETGKLTDITKNIYLLTKFGNNYQAVAKQCENFVTVKSILLPNGKVFLLDREGNAVLFDVDASVIWSGNLSYRSFTPSSAVLYDNGLWMTYPDCNAILKYSLATMREELKIGGKNSPFDKPRDIFLSGDKAMISNISSKKLIELDLKEYTVFDYEIFDEPVYQYAEVCSNRFVLLESGLYLLS